MTDIRKALDVLADRLATLTARLPPEDRDRYCDVYELTNRLADALRECPEVLGCNPEDER